MTSPLLGLSGAVAGDLVTITPTSAPEAGLLWTGYCATAGRVTLRVANITTKAINPTNRAWLLDVTSAD